MVCVKKGLLLALLPMVYKMQLYCSFVNRIYFLKTTEICQVEEYNKSHKIFAQRWVICYYSEEQKEKKYLKE